MKTRWIGAATVALAVLGAGGWLLSRGTGEPAARADAAGARTDGMAPAMTAAAPARVLTVGYTLAPQWIETTGTVRAELEAPVGTKVSGRVVSVLVRQGDPVRRGQPLLQLDARDLDAAILQAGANVRAADVGYDTARVAARMEAATSDARITAARAQVAQSDAALKAARAKLDLAQAGPRRQERTQASLAVGQAKANLDLAEATLHRYESLVNQGAIARQTYDQVKTQYDVAKAQFETAQQAQSMTDEGSRAEEIRAAQEGVRQAQAALSQAQAGLRQAQAAALQVSVRAQEIRGAQAQVGQAQAALQIARVTRDYATITAPFAGVVTARLVDPGTMASPGVPLLKVQGGQIRLEAIVPESALGAVRPGAAIPVRLDALRGHEQTGHVVEIAPQGDAASHTFLVKIGLAGDSGARAGMFGRARLRVGAERRLLVPASAVVEREGLRYLYVVDAGGKARLRLVTTGDAEGGRVPVLAGLNDGERIVAAGADAVADGETVR